MVALAIANECDTVAKDPEERGYKRLTLYTVLILRKEESFVFQEEPEALVVIRKNQGA